MELPTKQNITILTLKLKERVGHREKEIGNSDKIASERESESKTFAKAMNASFWRFLPITGTTYTVLAHHQLPQISIDTQIQKFTHTIAMESPEFAQFRASSVFPPMSHDPGLLLKL